MSILKSFNWNRRRAPNLYAFTFPLKTMILRAFGESDKYEAASGVDNQLLSCRFSKIGGVPANVLVSRALVNRRRTLFPVAFSKFAFLLSNWFIQPPPFGSRCKYEAACYNSTECSEPLWTWHSDVWRGNRTAFSARSNWLQILILRYF